MDQLKRVTPWIWILLPLIASFLIHPMPAPVRVSYSFHQAREAFNRSEPIQAVPYLHLITTYYPWRIDLYEPAGLAEAAAQQYDSAVIDLSTALAHNGLSLEGKEILADGYQHTGQVARSLEIWRQLINAGYPADKIFPQMIAVLNTIGEGESILLALDEWRKASPENSQAWYQSGIFYLAEKPWDGLDYLLKARLLDNQLDAQVRMVQIQLGAAYGLNQPAYDLVVAGRSLGNLGEWALAERAFGRAILINAGYAEAWAYLGEAQEKLGKDGLPSFQRAMVENPASPIIHALLGSYWSRRGNSEKALQYLESAAALDPLNGVWWVEMGNVNASAGHSVAALACFQKAIDLEPQNTGYWKALAHFSISLEFNIPLVGLPAARKVVQLAGDDAEGEILLGQALALQGDAVSAERAYRQALRLQPTSAQAYLLLGQLYFKIDRKSESRLAFQQAEQFGQDDGVREQAQRWLQYWPP